MPVFIKAAIEFIMYLPAIAKVGLEVYHILSNKKQIKVVRKSLKDARKSKTKADLNKLIHE